MSHTPNNQNNNPNNDKHKTAYLKINTIVDQRRVHRGPVKHNGQANIDSLRSLYAGSTLQKAMGDQVNTSIQQKELYEKMQRSIKQKNNISKFLNKDNNFTNSSHNNSNNNNNNNTNQNIDLVYQPKNAENQTKYQALLSFSLDLTPGLNHDALTSLVDDLIVIIKNDSLDTPQNVEKNVKMLLQKVSNSPQQLSSEKYTKLYHLVTSISDYIPPSLTDDGANKGYSGTMDDYTVQDNDNDDDEKDGIINWLDNEISSESEIENNGDDDDDDDRSDDGDGIGGGDDDDDGRGRGRGGRRLINRGDDNDDDDGGELYDDGKQFENEEEYQDQIFDIDEDDIARNDKKNNHKNGTKFEHNIDDNFTILNVSPSWFLTFLKQSTAEKIQNSDSLSSLREDIYKLLSQSIPTVPGGNPEIDLNDLDDGLNSLLDFSDSEIVMKLIQNRFTIFAGIQIYEIKNQQDKRRRIIDLLQLSDDFLTPLKPLLSQYKINPLSIMGNENGNENIPNNTKNEKYFQKALQKRSKLPVWKREVQLIDLELLKQQTITNSQYSTTELHFPSGTKHTIHDNYTEIIVPAAQQINITDKTDPNYTHQVEISTLPPRAQLFFPGVSRLNKIQSKIYNIALESSDNMLICAPTGAGKTNCAMLTISREILAALHNGTIESTQIVYIAPMKALVREVVSNLQGRFENFNNWLKQGHDSGLFAGQFSSSFARNGINVQELSGDIQVTADLLSNSQVLVSTPEKWDILTRKENIKSLYKNVKLVIIDEIHLLQDSRGPILESIVARGLHYCGQFGHYIRFVGLSATLENYRDVARFLRVPETGLFFFDSSFRPCPLQMNYIAIEKNNPGSFGGLKLPSVISRGNELKGWKYELILNEICYEKFIQYAPSGPVLIFVHSRRDTFLTAKYLLQQAQVHKTDQNGDDAGLDVLTDVILKHNPMNMSNDELTSFVERLDDPNLKTLIPFGFGIHHGGMSRNDRSIMEDLYAARKLHTLVTTATLAWGVNLPAHSVIIKGTHVYNAEMGKMVPISCQDVIQMLGRAGRPQYDTYGDGVIISSKSDIQIYIAAVIAQSPIESQLIHRLPDLLNAEIVNGNVSSLDDAVNWLGYTYFAARLVKNPSYYGVFNHYKTTNLAEIAKTDPYLRNYQTALIHSTLVLLSQYNMVEYNLSTRFISSRIDGILAAKYYINYETMKLYTQRLNPNMSHSDILSLFSLSHEFQYLSIRNEEKLELEQLYYQSPIVIAESVNEPASKVNILLQCYISRLQLKGMNISTDMIFIAQSAGRLMSCLYEFASSRKYSAVALIALSLSISIQNRCWEAQCPLRQFIPAVYNPSGRISNQQVSIQQQLNPTGVLSNLQTQELANQYNLINMLSTALENADLGWSVLLNSSPETIEQTTKLSQAYGLIHSLPNIYCTGQLVPITATELRLNVVVEQDFHWVMKNKRIRGSVQRPCTIPHNSLHFTCHVYGNDFRQALYVHNFSINQHQHKNNIDISFTIPILLNSLNNLPTAYYVIITSTQYLHCQAMCSLPMKDIILPQQFKPLSLLPREAPFKLSQLPKLDSMREYFARNYPGNGDLSPLLTKYYIELSKLHQNEAKNIIFASSFDKYNYTIMLELIFMTMVHDALLKRHQNRLSNPQSGNKAVKNNTQNDDDEGDDDDDDDEIPFSTMLLIVPTQQQANNLYSYWQNTNLFTKYLIDPNSQTLSPCLSPYLLRNSDHSCFPLDLEAIISDNVIIGTIEQYTRLLRFGGATLQSLSQAKISHVVFSDIQFLGQEIFLTGSCPQFSPPTPSPSQKPHSLITHQYPSSLNTSNNTTQQYEGLILMLTSLFKQIGIFNKTQFIGIGTSAIANASDLASFLNVPDSNIFSYDNSISKHPRDIHIVPTHSNNANYLSLLLLEDSDLKNNFYQNNHQNDNISTQNLTLYDKLSSTLSPTIINNFTSHIQNTSLLHRISTACATGQVALFLSNNDLAFVLGHFIAQMLAKYSKVIMDSRYHELTALCREYNIPNPPNGNMGMNDDHDEQNKQQNIIDSPYQNVLLSEYFAGKYRPHSVLNQEHGIGNDAEPLTELEEYNLLTILIHGSDSILESYLPHLSSDNLNLIVLGIAVIYTGIQSKELEVIQEMYIKGIITIIIVNNDMIFHLSVNLSANLTVLIDFLTYNNRTYSYDSLQTAQLIAMAKISDPRTALNTVMVNEMTNNSNFGPILTPRQPLYISSRSNVVVFSPSSSQVDILRAALTKPLCVESQFAQGVPNLTSQELESDDVEAILALKKEKIKNGEIISANFINQINNQIVWTTVTNYETLLQLFPSTFYYKRLIFNPTFYNISSSQSHSSFLSLFSQSNIQLLASQDLIKVTIPPKRMGDSNVDDVDDVDDDDDDDDDDDTQRAIFSPHFLGRCMAKYNIDYRTMITIKTLLTSVGVDQTLHMDDIILSIISTIDMINTISIPPQYHPILAQIGNQFDLYKKHQQVLEKKLFNSDQDDNYFTNNNDDGDNDTGSGSSKTLLRPSSLILICLLLHFSRQKVPTIISTQISLILSKFHHILNLFIDIILSKKLSHIFPVLTLSQCITHGVLPPQYYYENSRFNLYKIAPNLNPSQISYLPVQIYSAIESLSFGPTRQPPQTPQGADLSRKTQLQTFHYLSNLLQIPHTNPKIALLLLQKHQIESINDMVSHDDITTILNEFFTLPQRMDIVSFLNNYPSPDDDDIKSIAKIDQSKGVQNSKVFIKMCIPRYEDEKSLQMNQFLIKTGNNIINNKSQSNPDEQLQQNNNGGLPFTRRENWFVTVLDQKGRSNTKIDFIGRVKLESDDENMNISIEYPLPQEYQHNPQDYKIIVKVLCDGYLGADITFDQNNENEITFKIQK